MSNTTSQHPNPHPRAHFFPLGGLLKRYAYISIRLYHILHFLPDTRTDAYRMLIPQQFVAQMQ